MDARRVARSFASFCAMKTQVVPELQFPMGDYACLMESG